MKLKTLAIVCALGLVTAGIAAAGNNAVGTAWKDQDAAGQIIFPADTTNGPLITFKPSANVHMSLDSTGQAYTVGAYHESGTKIYATSSGDAKIYMYDTGAAIGTTKPNTVIPAANTISWGAGWSAVK